jgi:hypothetical protein
MGLPQAPSLARNAQWLCMIRAQRAGYSPAKLELRRGPRQEIDLQSRRTNHKRMRHPHLSRVAMETEATHRNDDHGYQLLGIRIAIPRQVRCKAAQG